MNVLKTVWCNSVNIMTRPRAGRSGFNSR